MKVSAQEIEQRQMVLEIEVEDERFQRAMDQAYQRISQRVNVPGFRRGRAPRPLVERMVGREAIVEDAVDKLVPEVYRDALKEQDIAPSGQPSLEVTSTEPLQFKATLPLQPRVDLGDYHSIDVRPEPVTVEQQDVDEFIDRMRQAHVTWAPVERPAQLGDRVGISVQAVRAGENLWDSQDAEFVVDPSGPEPVPGFSAELVGLEAGQEKSFSLGGAVASEVTEETAEAEQAPSERTDFTVKLQWVKEKELPALDDEFATLVSDHETFDKLLEETRGHLTTVKEMRAREKHREAVVDALVEQATVEIPPQLINRQAEHSVHSMATSLGRQGLSIEQYLQYTGREEEQFRSEMLADAERLLKRTLVIEKLGTVEGIEVSEDEIRFEIEAASQRSKDPARAIRQALASPETRERLEQVIRSRKAVERLVEMSGAVAPEADTPVAETVSSGESA